MERMVEGREEVSLFLERSMNERESESDMSPGIPPVRRLLASSSLCSFSSLPKPMGMELLRRLFCILTRTRDWQVDRVVGIGPEKMLLKRMSLVRFPLLHNVEGISPEKEFVETSSHSKENSSRDRLVARRRACCSRARGCVAPPDC